MFLVRPEDLSGESSDCRACLQIRESIINKDDNIRNLKTKTCIIILLNLSNRQTDKLS